VPAVFHAHLHVHHQQANEQEVSMEIAAILFACYVLLLIFSLRTHRHLYFHPPEEGTEQADRRGASPAWVWVLVLLGSTALVAVMSELLVGAISVASRELGWTELFVGVVVIAVIGNAAEHWTAVAVAVKNQTELSFQIAVGSGLQIAMFVAPLLVFVSRLPGFAHLDLMFTTLEVVSVGVSVIVIGLVAQDGESTWIEGMLLMAVYAIMAIAFFNLPESSPAPAPASACLPWGASGQFVVLV
jgi:Ca2+:H+ antiporter